MIMIVIELKFPFVIVTTAQRMVRCGFLAEFELYCEVVATVRPTRRRRRQRRQRTPRTTAKKRHSKKSHGIRKINRTI